MRALGLLAACLVLPWGLSLAGEPTADGLPCWFYVPSPQGVPGAIGTARNLSLGERPEHLARMRAAERLLAGLGAGQDALDPAQRRAIREGERRLAVGGQELHLAAEIEHRGYVYAYATVDPGFDAGPRCPQLAQVRPQACEPAWLCAPVQPEAVGVVGVSGRAGSPEEQFRYAVQNGLQILEYTYGVRVEGEERFLHTRGGLGDMRLRLSEYDVERAANVPASVRLGVRELRYHGDTLYVWLTSPDLPAYEVPRDLSWRAAPVQPGIVGETGTARRTWDGRLSTQIDTAVKRALFNLAKADGADVHTVDVLHKAEAGTRQGRATLIRVQRQLKAQLLGLHIEPDGPVDVWMGRPEP